MDGDVAETTASQGRQARESRPPPPPAGRYPYSTIYSSFYTDLCLFVSQPLPLTLYPVSISSAILTPPLYQNKLQHGRQSPPAGTSQIETKCWSG